MFMLLPKITRLLPALTFYDFFNKFEFDLCEVMKMFVLNIFLTLNISRVYTASSALKILNREKICYYYHDSPLYFDADKTQPISSLTTPVNSLEGKIISIALTFCKNIMLREKRKKLFLPNLSDYNISILYELMVVTVRSLKKCCKLANLTLNFHFKNYDVYTIGVGY